MDRGLLGATLVPDQARAALGRRREQARVALRLADPRGSQHGLRTAARAVLLDGEQHEVLVHQPAQQRLGLTQARRRCTAVVAGHREVRVGDLGDPLVHRREVADHRLGEGESVLDPIREAVGNAGPVAAAAASALRDLHAHDRLGVPRADGEQLARRVPAHADDRVELAANVVVLGDQGPAQRRDQERLVLEHRLDHQEIGVVVVPEVDDDLVLLAPQQSRQQLLELADQPRDPRSLEGRERRPRTTPPWRRRRSDRDPRPSWTGSKLATCCWTSATRRLLSWLDDMCPRPLRRIGSQRNAVRRVSSTSRWPWRRVGARRRGPRAARRARGGLGLRTMGHFGVPGRGEHHCGWLGRARLVVQLRARPRVGPGRGPRMGRLTCRRPDAGSTLRYGAAVAGPMPETRLERVHARKRAGVARCAAASTGPMPGQASASASHHPRC